MIPAGTTELVVGDKANVSDVPVLGGLKADKGNLGKFFGPFRRPPARPGECSGGGIGAEDMEARSTCGRYKSTARASNIQTVYIEIDSPKSPVSVS